LIKLYLASASPRRQELLIQLGFAFEKLVLDVPEIRGEDESPEHYGQRVALLKAQAGFAHLGQPVGVVVLGADTEVVLDGVVFGKPQDAEHARAMLQQLSGRTHAVMSAVAAVRSGLSESLLQVSNVQFKPLSADEMSDYIASGEPFGKAGGYAIQGRAAAFIASLQGSYSGVMGLPLFETTALLARFDMQPNSA
jgi:septum formation protein